MSKIQRRGRQTSFSFFDTKCEHGGSTSQNKRKGPRPIAVKKPMHVVLRASCAKGPYSLQRLSNQKFIDRLIPRLSKKFSVQVYDYANVGNHIHLLIRTKTKEGFRNFLRVFAALTARTATGAKKGSPFGKFWDGLAYSCFVNWGMHLGRLFDYIRLNQLEALGWAYRNKQTGKVIWRI